MTDGIIFSRYLEKHCTACGELFPCTVGFFYTKVRENGRRYYTAKCIECTKEERAKQRDEQSDKVKDSSRKSYDRHKDKYNDRRRQKFASSPELREKKNQKTKQWFDENKDRMVAYRRLYRTENKQLIAARAAIFYKNNRDRFRQYRRARKATLRCSDGSFSALDIQKQIADQNEKCFWCQCCLSDDYHCDHYIPLARGGNNKPYNIVISCPTCNLSKGAKLPVEFFRYLRMIAGKMAELEKSRAYSREKMRERRASK